MSQSQQLFIQLPSNAITPLELLNLYFSDGKSTGNKQSKLWQRFNELLTWDAILNQGYQADLCPLLYYILTKWLPAFRDKGLAARGMTQLHNDVIMKLQSYYYANLRRNMLLLDELGRVLKAFNETGIDVIVLKGADLSETVYPDIALRPMGDVDLLVRKEDVQKVERLVIKLGYGNKSTQKFLRTFIDDFHYRYFKNERGWSFIIEIHWDLVHRSYFADIDHNQVWDKAIKINMPKTNIFKLCTVHRLVYLCWHICLHGFGRLLWLCDIALIFKSNRGPVHWDLIFQKSKEWKIYRPVLFTLFLMRNCLGEGVTVDDLREDELNSLNIKFFNHLVLKFQSKNSNDLKHKIISGLLFILLIDNRKDKHKFIYANIKELHKVRKWLIENIKATS